MALTLVLLRVVVRRLSQQLYRWVWVSLSLPPVVVVVVVVCSPLPPPVVLLLLRSTLTLSTPTVIATLSPPQQHWMRLSTEVSLGWQLMRESHHSPLSLAVAV